jgi:hypothetical protein
LENVWGRIHREFFFGKGYDSAMERTLRKEPEKIVDLYPLRENETYVKSCPLQMRGIARWGVANLSDRELSANLKNNLRKVLQDKLIQLFNGGIFTNIFVSRSEVKKSSYEELLDKYRKLFDVFSDEIVVQVMEQFEEKLKDSYPSKAAQSQKKKSLE